MIRGGGTSCCSYVLYEAGTFSIPIISPGEGIPKERVKFCIWEIGCPKFSSTMVKVIKKFRLSIGIE